MFAFVFFLAACVQVTYAQVAAWHMDSLKFLVNERLDSVVSPNVVASHMHHVVGGSAFAAAYNYADQIKSKCTTASISIDKSNYWMPKLYWINSNSSFSPLSANHRFYYFLGRSSPVQPVAPFPEGLRMLVGNPNSKTASSRFTFTCHVNSDLSTGSLVQDNFNFARDCPYGLRVESNFPSCWDGKTLYTSDNSHVVDPVGSIRGGSCPWSHPVRIPQIMLEFTFGTAAWAPGKTLSGNLAWANGDTTGYGVHADFINGWTTSVLEQALNDTQCSGSLSSLRIEECEVLSSYYGISSGCSPDRGVMTEVGETNDDFVPVDSLPGCNKLWASGSKPTCSSATSSPDVTAWQGTDGAYTATGSQNKAFVLPTTSGIHQIGCIRDTDTMLTSSIGFYDTAVSVTSCSNACLRSGYSYSAVGEKANRFYCQCGTGVEDNASLYPGMCNTTCPGNSAEYCGANFVHTVSYAGPGTVASSINSTSSSSEKSYLGCYSPAGDTSLASKITFTYTESTMTTETCLQNCANQGASWAATTNGKTCNCGTDYSVGSGYYVGESTCTSTCAGNSSEICGWTYGYSVYNVSASSYTSTNSSHPAGWKGCYNDPNAGLSSYTWAGNSMTPELCTYGCKDLGYSLAGVTGGNRCRCGNTWAGGDLYPASSCSTACAGNSSETCGGSYRTELYDTSVVATKYASDIAAKPKGWSGCYANSALTIFTDYSAYDSTLTVERCIAVCQTYNYTWAGVANTNTCRCTSTNPTTGTAARAPTNVYCTAACPGNKTETCGNGAQYVEAYNITANVATATSSSSAAGYVGCYSGTSGLTGTSFSDSAMTNTLCATGCKEMGYTLAGTSGSKCYCGNSWTTGSLLADLKCTTACPGNSTQTCGGSSITSVYKSEIGLTVAAASQTNYLGCYTDSGSARTLPAYSYSSSSMTNEVCKATCAAKGYSLAGTQYSNQCYCDNSIKNTGARTASSQCTSTCAGDSSLICGGSYKLSMFNATVATSATGSKGCYSDYGTLNAKSITSSYMTVGQCVWYCKGLGYAYSGLTGGNGCRCGNTAPSTVVASSQCSTACVSNSTQTCGGSSVVDVWASTQASQFVNPYTTADSSGYMGCWQDSSTRLLNGTSFSTSSMTPSTCQSNCAALGYKYSGTESGKQCFCGNVLSANLVRQAESNCATACSGSSSSVCGGSWAISVRLSSGSTTGTATSSAATSSSTTTTEGYSGCYAVGTFVSSASAKFTGSSAMSVSFCRRYCRVQGYAVAGLNSGNSCYCGTASTLGSRQSDSSCAATCTGSSEQCGDTYLASVYSTSGAGATSVAGYPANYVGCFTDSGSARILNDYSFSATSMSADVCSKTCAARGDNVYGTQNGNQCYCGTTVPTSMTTDNQCTVACSGNSTQICGGSYKLSLYSAEFASSSFSASSGTTSTSSSSSSTSTSTSKSSTNTTSTTIAATNTTGTVTSTTKANTTTSTISTSTNKTSTSTSTSKVSSATSTSTSKVSSSSTSSAKTSSATGTPSESTTAADESASTVLADPGSSAALSSTMLDNSTSTITVSSTVSSSASYTTSSDPSSSTSSISTDSSSTSTSPVSTDSAPISSTSTQPASTIVSTLISTLVSNATATLTATATTTVTASTTTASASTATASVGCYTATSFSNEVITCDVLTPGMCRLWCNSKGYAYAGMTNGTTCGCNNDISSLSASSDSVCTSQCFSDTTATCGSPSGAYTVWKSASLASLRRRRFHERELKKEHQVLEFLERYRT